MRAKAGDLCVYQVYEPTIEGLGNTWELYVDIVLEGKEEYYNKEGAFKNNNYINICYIIPKEKIKQYKINEFKRYNEKPNKEELI